MKQAAIRLELPIWISKMTLDLHGFSVDKATAALLHALFDFRHNDQAFSLKIIPGRGAGIIRLTVLDLLDAEGIIYQSHADYIVVNRADNQAHWDE